MATMTIATTMSMSMTRCYPDFFSVETCAAVPRKTPLGRSSGYRPVGIPTGPTRARGSGRQANSTWLPANHQDGADDGHAKDSKSDDHFDAVSHKGPRYPWCNADYPGIVRTVVVEVDVVDVDGVGVEPLSALPGDGAPGPGMAAPGEWGLLVLVGVGLEHAPHSDATAMTPEAVSQSERIRMFLMVPVYPAAPGSQSRQTRPGNFRRRDR